MGKDRIDKLGGEQLLSPEVKCAITAGWVAIRVQGYDFGPSREPIDSGQEFALLEQLKDLLKVNSMRFGRRIKHFQPETDSAIVELAQGDSVRLTVLLDTILNTPDLPSAYKDYVNGEREQHSLKLTLYAMEEQVVSDLFMSLRPASELVRRLGMYNDWIAKDVLKYLAQVFGEPDQNRSIAIVDSLSLVNRDEGNGVVRYRIDPVYHSLVERFGPNADVFDQNRIFIKDALKSRG